MTANIVKKERDAGVDNLKGILIFLVVFAHLIEIAWGYAPELKYVYVAVYAFHMPLFIFLSGMFTKVDDGTAMRAFKRFLIPYLIFNILYQLFKSLLAGQAPTISIFTPNWVFWYLLSMFLWSTSLLWAKKLRFAVAVVVIAAIIVGFFPEINRFLSLSRTFCFFPFFLIGHMYGKELMALTKKLPRIAFVGGLLALFALAIAAFHFGWIQVGMLYFADGYAAHGFDPAYVGVLTRVLLLVLAATLCFCMLVAIPRKNTFFTPLGKYTLTIFLLHPFIYSALQKLDLSFFGSISPIFSGAILFVASVIICVLLGNAFVNKAYGYLNTFIDFVFTKKVSKEET